MNERREKERKEIERDGKIRNAEKSEVLNIVVRGGGKKNKKKRLNDIVYLVISL